MGNKKLKNFEFANHAEQGKLNLSGVDEVEFFECNNGSVFLICQNNNRDKQEAEVGPARLAAQRIRYYLENEFVVNPVNAIYNALIYTNGFIYEYGRKNQDLQDVCVHCAVLLIRDNKVYYATFGNMAVYCFTGKKLFLLSQGDKRIPYPLQHPESDTDLEKNPEHLLGKCRTILPDVNIEAMIPLDKDLILMGSRGFYEKVPDKIISRVLSDPMPVQNKVYRIVDHASVAGGEDNISLQLISFYNLGHTVRQIKPLDVHRTVPVKKPNIEYIKAGDSGSDKSRLDLYVEMYLTTPVKVLLLLLGLTLLGYMVYDLFVYNPVPVVTIPPAIAPLGNDTLAVQEVVRIIPIATPPEANPSLSDSVYLVRQGDTWGRIYSQFGVCSWFIRSHPANSGRFDAAENPIAGSRISIPLLYSAKRELNPEHYLEFSMEKTGTRCEHANRAFIDSFLDKHF
jgi:serine/threonine protein phosphatase PrpC